MSNKKIDLLIQNIMKYANNSMKHSLPVFTYEPQFKEYSREMKLCTSETSTQQTVAEESRDDI